MKRALLTVVMISFSLCQVLSTVKHQARIHVLIVDGYSNHDWKQTTAVTKRILEGSKLFDVAVTTAPATTNEDSLAAWDPDFSSYDVVIQNTNNINNKVLHWPRKAEIKLERYVASGGGLYILHSANNAFPHWKEYDVMIGLGWRPKETGFALEIDGNNNVIRIPPGEGDNTGHGKRFDALIHILNRHPINHDFPAQWRTASMELYTYARGPAKNITVLSYSFDTATNKSWPVDWVVGYGKGRVYNSSMGHLWKDEIYPVSYRCAGFQTTLIRAVEWLARGKVTYPLPADFPTEEISLREESDYAGKQSLIRPGELWPDENGDHIQAHGGGIIRLGDTYYWYGEQRSRGLDTNYRYVSCYSSNDLMNWKFRGNALKLADPEHLGEKWILERPKVFYNPATKKYVMYFHLDDSPYKYARVGIATCDKPDGPFTYLKSFRPLGLESRDIGQFIDDDGTPYLIFESRPSKGFYIAGLSGDYLDVDRQVAFMQAPLEGGAIVHYDGLYYAIGSALTGWSPNPNKYASAPSLSGPWSEFKDIAPPATNTYHSQSTMMLKVAGQKTTTVIFLADRWNPAAQWDSRYLWMPLDIGQGRLWLPEPKPWALNVKTGEWKLAAD